MNQRVQRDLRGEDVSAMDTSPAPSQTSRSSRHDSDTEAVKQAVPSRAKSASASAGLVHVVSAAEQRRTLHVWKRRATRSAHRLARLVHIAGCLPWTGDYTSRLPAQRPACTRARMLSAPATSEHQRAVRGHGALDTLDLQAQLLQRLLPMPGAGVPQQSSVIAAHAAPPLSLVSPADVAAAAAAVPLVHGPMLVVETTAMDTTPTVAPAGGTSTARNASYFSSACVCRSS
jgi:hypothetical protein